MPKVVREDIDNLNAVISVSIEKADYESSFKSELKKVAKQAQVKGFRKGKTPISFVKKMYGPSILMDTVNNILQEEMSKYLQDDKTNYLGQPIPAENQDKVDFDPNNLSDFEFKFDAGIAPELKIKGADKKTKLEQYKIKVDDKMLDEELENIKKRLGERELDEEKILEGDLVKLSVKELDGKKVKEGGVESEFSLVWEKIADKKLQKALLKQKKGDTFTVNPFKVEKDAEEKYVKKYFLGMEDDTAEVGDKFEATIVEVSRVSEVELNQEAFDKVFGEGVISSVEEAKAKIGEDIGKYYAKQTEGLLFRKMQDNLIEKNEGDIQLPDAFLKRWLLISNEKNTVELIEKEYNDFAKNLKWSLIKGELNEKFDVKLEEADIKAGLRERVKGYMQGAMGDNPEFLDGMVERLMGDQEQVTNMAEELAADKLFENLRDAITVKEKAITVEQFQEVVKEINEKDAAEKAAREAAVA